MITRRTKIMSERFLKYETEVENSLVDERGVLIPGASAGGAVAGGVYTVNLYKDSGGYRTFTDGSTFDGLLNACKSGFIITINDGGRMLTGYICTHYDNSIVILNRCYMSHDLGGSIIVEEYSFAITNEITYDEKSVEC